MNRKITQTKQVSHRETADRKTACSLSLLFAFVMLIGVGTAWAQVDPCSKTYDVCSGGNVVLSHDASCGNGGSYFWAAIESDGNYFYNGVYTPPTLTYSTGNFGINPNTGGIGGGWGDGENPAHVAASDENRCHYPGSMTVDIKNSNSNDPYIYFPIPEGADPNIYRYFIIRYRVNFKSTADDLGNMELFFFNNNHTDVAHPNNSYRLLNTHVVTNGNLGQLYPKCSTNGYTEVVVDTWTANGNWKTGGKITGLRLDPISYNTNNNKQVHMSIDYIGLVTIVPPSTDNTLTLENVTENTTMKSYQINTNGSVSVTQQANSSTYMHNAAGKIYYGWTSTESIHDVQVFPELNAGAIATGDAERCYGDATAIAEIGETTPASQATDATLSYKWYVSKDDGTPTVIPDATSNTFTPDINNYTASGTYVFTRVVSSSLCEASPKTSDGTFTLVVKPEPVVNTVSNQTFYTNDGVKTVNFTSTVDGVDFAWTNDNTAIGLATGGTGNISFTPTNNTPDDLVANISVTPKIGNCLGTPMDFTITVKNGVTMNDITDYMPNACSGTNVIAAFTSEIEGVSYSWSHTNTNVTPASGTVGTDGDFSQAFTNSTNAAQTVTFSVTPTKGGVNGLAKTFEVTIYPTPTVSITAPATVCPKSTPTFTGTVTTTTTGDYTYTWDGDGDGFLIEPYTVTQSATTHTPTTVKAPSNCNQTFTVTLYLEDGNGCEATATKTVAVKDVTAPTIGDVTVPAAEAAGNCQYAIPDLEDAVLAVTTDDCNSTITWVSQSPAAGTLYNQQPSAQNVTVTVNVKDACNNPQTKTVTVTIPANTLNPTISASATCICLGGIATFSATEGYSSYSWSAGSTNAGLPATTNTSSITVTPTGAGEMSYTVTVSGDNGCSKNLSATLTVKPLPTISANPSTQDITYGDNIAPVQITAPTGATVTTTTLPDGLTYASSAISGKPTNVGNYTITATATVEDCTASTPITINVGKKNLTVTYTGTEAANTKVYDGTPLTLSYDKLTFTGLESGDAFTAGVITTDGYKVGTYVCNAGSFERMMADGVAVPSGFAPASVTSKYNVQFNVTLTITKRPLEITANSATAGTDATPLTDPGWTYTNGTSLAPTDQAAVVVTGSQSTIGSSPNVVGDVVITHTSDNETVTDCYDIAKVNGTLTVTAPPCPTEPCPTTLDYAGYTYPVVEINGRCWLAENLRAEIGEAVPYDGKAANKEKFGLLYSWTDALNGHATKETDPCNVDFVQGACPQGWALPSAADFDALLAFAHSIEGIRSDNSMYWFPQYLGTNATGFDERGGGLFTSSLNRFEELKSAAYFWTSEAILNPDAYNEGMALAFVDEYYCDKFIQKILPQSNKLSVRCIRTTPHGVEPPATSFTLEVNGPDKISICESSTTPVSATYTAVLDPAIATATYQWYVNGTAVNGAQSATFVKDYTTADEGTAVIKCEATANGTTEDDNVSTQVVVLETSVTENTLEVCDCQLPYTYDKDGWNETWTAADLASGQEDRITRTRTLTTAQGCDSILKLTLTTWSAASETPTTCTSVTTYNSNEHGNGSGLETVTDVDGNVYHVVQIGNQCWMKENLRVKHFANGTELHGVSSVDSGNRADIYYTYTNPTKTIKSLGPCDAENLTMDQHTERYGLLYNWYTAMGTNTPTDNMHNVQGICPDGWHLPDTAEWHALEAAIGITGVHSSNEFLGTSAIQLVTGCEWHKSDVSGSVGDYSAFGRNASGFSARPAGCFYDNEVTETVLNTTWHKDDVAYAGVWCFFWSSTKYNKPGFAGKAAYNYDLHFDQKGISRDVNGADYLIGRSVRCIRNN